MDRFENKQHHAGRKELWVKPATSIPVHITCFAAWVDRLGELNFHKDLNGQDESTTIAAINRQGVL
jgi:murein L,D-transpeptidase YcbB/YkuD